MRELDRRLEAEIQAGHLTREEADQVRQEQSDWKEGLGMESNQRDWIWPNRKQDLDCLALSEKDRALLKVEAEEHGLLEHLPALPLLGKLQPNDFLNEMPKQYAEGLALVERAWMYGSAASDQAIAYAWHLWRERIPRWESTSSPSVSWDFDWYKNSGGCGGMLIYNTWISIYELERYWLNWLIRCNGWLNQLTLRERITDFGEDKSDWGRLAREMLQPLQWYEAQGGIRLQEVVSQTTGFERDGVIFGGWSFDRNELLMRYDESTILYNVCMEFRAKADNRTEKKIANRLGNKIQNVLYHRLTPSYGFIVGKMEMLA